MLNARVDKESIGHVIADLLEDAGLMRLSVGREANVLETESQPGSDEGMSGL